MSYQNEPSEALQDLIFEMRNDDALLNTASFVVNAIFSNYDAFITLIDNLTQDCLIELKKRMAMKGKDSPLIDILKDKIDDNIEYIKRG